jgi:TonB family protein
VLASDEDGGTLEALKFSVASDIVELLVLTTDEVFLQTLRDAVGGARRLWHVLSADKVSDLLVAGEVGIVVVDAQALQETASVFVKQIKRQFPDLVVVAAGHRDDETSLAGLISAGLVYRFIHKPMSPARAKLFAEAAIRKYEDHRRRAAEAPRLKGASPPGRIFFLAGGAIGTLALAAGVAWIVHGSGGENSAPAPAAEAPKPAAAESSPMARAAAALAANRLTEPPGDNALELYLGLLAHDPADASARAGLTEVHERLLARAENALLEERLDEAAAAIETARKSGVEAGRIAFLTAQLAKSREQIKTAQAQRQQARARNEPKAEADRVTPLLTLATQRIVEDHLLEPDHDSARFYVQEALRADPQSTAALDAKRALASRLLEDVRSAIDRREFAHAAALIDSANGIAVPANLESVQGLLAAARKRADVDAWGQLLKNADERLLQDRLIEPANDNAKYFYLTLKQLDPGNAGLGSFLQNLGTRLVSKARRALILGQLDAAKSWLDEAGAIGFTSAEVSSAQHDLDTAIAKHNFMTNLVPVNQLTLQRSVQPVYPAKALANKLEGWVDLDFTVTEGGKVADVAVRTASTPGVFEDAAVKAVSQWRYQPMLRDARPVPVRTQIRIRFTVS